MGIFGFFRRNVAVVPLATGLIGHWKKEDGGSEAALRTLISQLEEGDDVTLVFQGIHIHQAAMAMRALSSKLSVKKESLPTLIQGIYRHIPEEGMERITYKSVSQVARHMPHRSRAEKRMLEKLLPHVIEFRVFRVKKDLTS